MTSDITLREVREQDLAIIVQLYNDVETFKFATGIESPTDIGTVELQYHFAQIDPTRYLLGICSLEPSSGRELMVGVIDVLIDHPEESWATIGLFLVASEWQRKGVGTRAAEILEKDLHERFGTQGCRVGLLAHEGAPAAFWLKLGYEVTQVEHNHTLIEGSPRDLIWLTKSRNQE